MSIPWDTIAISAVVALLVIALVNNVDAIGGLVEDRSDPDAATDK